MFCLSFFTACSQSAPPFAANCNSPALDEIAVVDKVLDGDTIRLTDQRVVRFIGINTPELARDSRPAQPLAQKATAALRAMIPAGSQVGLWFDESRHDRHRRTLAHVFRLSGTDSEQHTNLTAYLISQGFGFAITVPPNNRLHGCYFEQESTARQAGLGIWVHPAYQAKPVNTLRRADTGFQYVSGTVTRIGKSRKNIWLDIGDDFAIQIPRRHLQYFDGTPIETLQGRSIRVRGWVAFYNDKLRVSIGHSRMLEIMD